MCCEFVYYGSYLVLVMSEFLLFRCILPIGKNKYFFSKKNSKNGVHVRMGCKMYSRELKDTRIYLTHVSKFQIKPLIS